ncbi:uncharacterized protein KY384_004039 [Bacidia gigantensis]|uniref:uncharacterized protein n=1 Tax=Bacidia gigantensis TaxID=2732470 RepID=UPI001D04E35D|nr:uncharacterized protein KY384_004039 [Bacidia gigantensis]KAG8530684.1 hypothetical protein KY384_004039 [Bacidia gigantensis]
MFNPHQDTSSDPWWIFTALCLLYNIKKRYNFGYIKLVRTSPRFGLMLVSMLISIVFAIVDVLSATVKFGGIVGINPYWKLSLVFKCFCDTIILDDFQSALEKIRRTFFGDIKRDNGSVALHDQGNSGRFRNKKSLTSNSFGNTVNINTVPKSYEKHNTGIRDMLGHSRLASEDDDKIYVSTDIRTSTDRDEQDDDLSGNSVSTPREQRYF